MALLLFILTNNAVAEVPDLAIKFGDIGTIELLSSNIIAKRTKLWRIISNLPKVRFFLQRRAQILQALADALFENRIMVARRGMRYGRLVSAADKVTYLEMIAELFSIRERRWRNYSAGEFALVITKFMVRKFDVILWQIPKLIATGKSWVATVGSGYFYTLGYHKFNYGRIFTSGIEIRQSFGQLKITTSKFIDRGRLTNNFGFPALIAPFVRADLVVGQNHEPIDPSRYSSFHVSAANVIRGQGMGGIGISFSAGMGFPTGWTMLFMAEEIAERDYPPPTNKPSWLVRVTNLLRDSIGHARSCSRIFRNRK